MGVALLKPNRNVSIFYHPVTGQEVLEAFSGVLWLFGGLLWLVVLCFVFLIVFYLKVVGQFQKV